METYPAMGPPKGGPGEIEKFIVEQLKAIGKDPTVVAATPKETQKEAKETISELKTQERAAAKELARHLAKLQKLTGDVQRAGDMADLQDRIRSAEQQLTVTREQIVSASQLVVEGRDVVTALSTLGPVWETLSPREQARVVRLLIERVDYDGKAGTISLTFRPSGMQALSQEQTRKEAA